MKATFSVSSESCSKNTAEAQGILMLLSNYPGLPVCFPRPVRTYHHTYIGPFIGEEITKSLGGFQAQGAQSPMMDPSRSRASRDRVCARQALFVRALLFAGMASTSCGATKPTVLAGADPSARDGAMKTAFVYGAIYLAHKTGAGHPERPERLEAIVRRLNDGGLMDRLIPIPPTPAATEWITTIHSPQYVERVRKACAEGEMFMDSSDTPISAQSYDAAVAAVGGILAAVDAVVEGKARNAFCAVRPPGHHALKDQAMGFCLFNNVAIATRYVQKKHGLTKVLIVDWDVHHGNGTQAAFDDDPTVLEFDLHQHPFYPGSGTADEKGKGKAVGLKINVPLPAGSGDEAYKTAMETRLKPAALEFRPDFVLISAGFDAHKADPLGGMKVTPEGYAAMTRIVRQIAETCCKGRIVSVLEGGYDLEGLADSVEAHVRALME